MHSAALRLEFDVLAEGNQSARCDVGLDERLHDEIGQRTGLAGTENALDRDASNQFRIEIVLQVPEGFLELFERRKAQSEMRGQLRIAAEFVVITRVGCRQR